MCLARIPNQFTSCLFFGGKFNVYFYFKDATRSVSCNFLDLHELLNTSF